MIPHPPSIQWYSIHWCYSNRNGLSDSRVSSYFVGLSYQSDYSRVVLLVTSTRLLWLVQPQSNVFLAAKSHNNSNLTVASLIPGSSHCPIWTTSCPSCWHPLRSYTVTESVLEFIVLMTYTYNYALKDALLFSTRVHRNRSSYSRLFLCPLVLIFFFRVMYSSYITI